jgi:secondary thiamine-phosphate synthase enzyme
MRDTYRPVREGAAVTGATLTAVETQVITVRTGSRPTVVDLTAEANAFVQGRGDGLLHVFTPHATAGLAIIETGAGSDVDLLAALDDALPADERWRHRHGSSGHGRDHVMPAFIAPYASLPVIDGRVALGTWQSICLVDPNADNPTRQVRFSFLAG